MNRGILLDEHFEIFDTKDGKRKGVRSKIPIEQGALCLEYRGERITRKEAIAREEADPNATECYTFWAKYRDQWVIIDATKEEKSIARYVNHSKQHANLVPILSNRMAAKDIKIVFKAIRNIAVGEELLFDYKDNRKGAVEANSWLAN